jgi:hypothetical protein
VRLRNSMNRQLKYSVSESRQKRFAGRDEPSSPISEQGSAGTVHAGSARCAEAGEAFRHGNMPGPDRRFSESRPPDLAQSDRATHAVDGREHG